MRQMLRFVFWFLTAHTTTVVANAGPRSKGACVDTNTFTFIANRPASKSSLFLQRDSSSLSTVLRVRGGGWWYIFSGLNPFGYKITALGEQFLAFDGSHTCDVGRFLSSLKAGRKRKVTIKAAWLEIMRASKSGQAMRIYRTLDELLLFCLKAGLID